MRQVLTVMLIWIMAAGIVVPNAAFAESAGETEVMSVAPSTSEDSVIAAGDGPNTTDMNDTIDLPSPSSEHDVVVDAVSDTASTMPSDDGMGVEADVFAVDDATERDVESADTEAQVVYNAHVQRVGWQRDADATDEWYRDGETAGTMAQSLRLEAVQLVVSSDVAGSIVYQVHVQGNGWQDWRSDGEIAGSVGQGLRLEAIRIKLEGDIASLYEVYYRAHAQGYGWLGWTCAGKSAGTTGLALRLEAIEVMLRLIGSDDVVPLTSAAAVIGAALTVSAHVQDVGWTPPVSAATNAVLTVGSTGQGRRLEALTVTLSGDTDGAGWLSYNAHVRNVGWQGDVDDAASWAAMGTAAGTTGRSLAIEALQIGLSDDAAQYYDLYYRVHVAYDGWLDWTMDGLAAGSVGRNRRVEAVQLVLVSKGMAPPNLGVHALVDATGLSATTVALATADGAVAASCVGFVGTTPYLFLPSFANLTDLTLEGGGLYASSSFEGPYQEVGDVLDVQGMGLAQASDGAWQLYVKTHAGYSPTLMYVMRSANIMTMYLMSDDPTNRGRAYVEASPDHTAKATGSMLLVAADGQVAYDGSLTQIKGRGHTTWTGEKRPYQIKLGTKSSLLDATSKNRAKTWILLANYGDPTAIKNYLSYRLGSYLGLTETPECDFVDLYYDGEYRGTYLLSEKVEINAGRVDIDEIENGSTDATNIENHPTARGVNRYGYRYQYVRGVREPLDYSGGYLIESDGGHYAAERSWFNTNYGTYVIKNPEDASQREVAYISELFQHLINHGSDPAIFDGLLDLDTAVYTWLVQTLAKNGDYPLFSSAYYYKKAGDDRIYAGPLWDFDSAYGGYVNVREPTGMEYMRNIFYYDNPLFRSRVRTVFDEVLKPLVEEVVLGDGSRVDGCVSSIAATVAYIGDSQAMNERLWGITHLGHTVVYGNTFEDNVSYLSRWISVRVSYLDKLFNSSAWC